MPQIVPAEVLNASTGQGVLPCLGGCTRHRCVFVGKDKDRMLAGLLSMLLHCADAIRLQGCAGDRALTVGALCEARAVAEGLDWSWKHELAGERVNDQNPLRSARRVRQDFGMIRLESSGSDCSMGMSFRGKGVNPSYTPKPEIDAVGAASDSGVSPGHFECRGFSGLHTAQTKGGR